MERGMCNLLPIEEVEMEKIYKDQYGSKIMIQAGKHGWTILYGANGDSEYQDVDNTVEDNFKSAYDTVGDSFKPLTEIGDNMILNEIYKKAMRNTMQRKMKG